MKFLKKNKQRKGKISVISIIIIFIVLIIPFFLTRSTNHKVQFWGFTLLSTSSVILIFIIGMFVIIIKHPKEDNSLLKIVKIKGFGAVCLFISIYLGMHSLLSYYKDVPKIINSSYSSYEGELTQSYINYGRATSTNFKIRDKKFKVPGIFTKPLSIGKVYRVKFLPNSQFVMSIETIQTK